MDNKDKVYVEKILNNYEKKEVSKLDELKLLDRHVKMPIMIFSYVFGSICSLVLGFGMCLAMEVILPGNMVYGIIIGILGIFLCIINYFIYKKVLISRKNKYSSKIIEFSNELLKK